MLDLRGHFAPLVTPFTDDGSGVSEIRLARLVRKLQDYGVSGFVVCSEAGEFTCLSFSERKFVLEMVLRESQGALPVLAHVSTLSTSSSLDLAQHAKRHGGRAGILMPPYYPTYTQTEIEWHYRTLTQYSDLPLIAVDPLHRIEEPLQETLRSVGRLELAGGVSRSDCFEIPPANIEIQAGLPIELSKASGADISALGLRYGSAKVLKAALLELDIEVGPLRKPLENLESDVRKQVEEIISR